MKTLASKKSVRTAVCAVSIAVAFPTLVHSSGAAMVLHEFDVTDGATPTAALVEGPAGLFHGTTNYGGPNDDGTIFQIAADGSFTKLYDFSGTDGKYPTSLMLGSDGAFYGTTTDGASYGQGTIYRMTEGGLSTLYVFDYQGPTGYLPQGPLVEHADGKLYGTNYLGGSGGLGTLFRISKAGDFELVHTFDTLTEGCEPHALTPGHDGNFYGTLFGCGRGGYGATYRVTPAGEVTILHAFADSGDGNNPVSPLLLASDGNFYGTTQGHWYSGGGPSVGTVYRMTPAGVVTTLHVFTRDNGGGLPTGALIQASDGNIYGLTTTGGSEFETVFRVTLEGAVSIVHAFGASQPNSLIQGSDGKIYGTSGNGGAANRGTVFALDFGLPPPCPAENFTGKLVVSAPAYVFEGETVQVTVDRVDGTCGAVSASYSNGSGQRFEHVEGELHWDAGESGPRTVTFQTVQDDDFQLNQTIVFALSSPAGGVALGAAANIRLTNDEDYPVLSITPGAQTIAEGGPGTEVTLSLSGRSELEAQVTFCYGGTATSGEDYSAQTTFTFAPGTTRITYPLVATADDVQDIDETVVFNICAASNILGSGAPPPVVTISDQTGAPQLSIASADFTGAEGKTTTLTLALSHATSDTVYAPITWAGTAQLGADFLGPQWVRFNPGETTAELQAQLLADGLDENTETATATLGLPTGAVLGDASYVLTIADKDQPPTITFWRDGQTVAENAGSAELEIVMSAPSSKQVKVALSTSGKATMPADYTLPKTTVTIPAGQTSAVVKVYIVNDKDLELDENAVFTLGGAVNATVGATSKHTLTIHDNDPTIPGVGGVR